MKSFSLGILGSTRGTALQKIFAKIAQNQLPAEVKLVVSNKKDAYILSRAEEHAIPALFLDPKGLSREAYDQKLSALFTEHAVDLIILIGYMRILSDEFVKTWHGKMINVHPSLLPAFAGGMDQAVHQAVLDAGVQESGCTVHYVTEEVDAGPILTQKKCPVLTNDTVETLKTRVQALEGDALVEAILLILKGQAI